MKNRSWMRLAATPLLVAGLAGPLVLSGCGDPAELCGADLAARIDALNAAVDSLVEVSNKITVDVATACAGIATDLNGTNIPDVSDPSKIDDTVVKAACDSADAALSVVLAAGVTINIGIEGGYCEVNASAQFSCEADCSIDGSCDPGTVDVRCEPGELSVVCEGSCKGNAVCQGTATAAANCNGSCSGKCSGMCNGQATAAGGEVCDSTCEGTCTGDCKLEADVNIECGAEVRCKGGCDANYTAPRCEGEITPPSCDIDADCQAGCEGSAKFEAECVAPQVVVEFGGAADEALRTTLEKNLPILISVAVDQGPLMVEAAADVVTKFASASEAIGSSLACTAYSAANLAGNASLSVTASVNISASASASGKVGGTTGS